MNNHLMAMGDFYFKRNKKDKMKPIDMFSYREMCAKMSCLETYLMPFVAPHYCNSFSQQIAYIQQMKLINGYNI